MKKEEPSVSSERGNPSSLDETPGSLSRPGRTAAALTEKPALSRIFEFLIEAVVDASNTAPALMKLPGTRLKSFVEPPSAEPHARWCGEGGQQWPSLPDFASTFVARAQG